MLCVVNRNFLHSYYCHRYYERRYYYYPRRRRRHAAPPRAKEERKPTDTATAHIRRIPYDSAPKRPPTPENHGTITITLQGAPDASNTAYNRPKLLHNACRRWSPCRRRVDVPSTSLKMQTHTLITRLPRNTISKRLCSALLVR